MSYSTWLGPFGWSVFFFSLIIAIALFAYKRKFYPVTYLVSIATYIFTVGFMIDAFDLDRVATFLSLAFSSALFIGLGVYFSMKFEKRKKSLMKSVPSKK